MYQPFEGLDMIFLNWIFIKLNKNYAVKICSMLLCTTCSRAWM